MQEYTVDDIRNQIKPLSQNGFVRFFQKIARWWLGLWYGFCDKHPKGSSLLYKLFFFVVFSMGVTVWQYIVMTFLPYAFNALNDGAWGWPGWAVGAAGGEKYIIFGDNNGLGYFIAFEIAVFTAQCINFPLQRNITYRSHGNVWWQIMWYFIGWVLVSIFTLALWGIVNCFLVYWGWPNAVTGLVKTVITGGVSMVIFFFIFMIIFPDNAAVAKRARKKCEKLTAAKAPEDKIAAASLKAETAEKRAALTAAEKEYAQAKSQASAKAIRYFASLDTAEKAKGTEKEKEAADTAERNYAEAVQAICTKEEKEKTFYEVKE